MFTKSETTALASLMAGSSIRMGLDGRWLHWLAAMRRHRLSSCGLGALAIAAFHHHKEARRNLASLAG
jgi:hypothetical protein